MRQDATKFSSDKLIVDWTERRENDKRWFYRCRGKR